MSDKLFLESRDGIKLFYCPGCGCCHWINDTWDFKNIDGKITVNPSIKVNYPDWKICHLFIRDNKIQYLSDCTHELKNTTVDMEEFE